ncbi:MAG: sugar ABC transporter permease [Chloroflexota bacterium]|nr:sugar ABC transporter permease [Chloroflexota bacterium]
MARGRRSLLAAFPTHIIVFLLPATLAYTLFMILPLLDSLRLSFFGGPPGRETFVGLQNYATLLMNPLYADRFWGALGHTLLFSAIHLLVQNPVGLFLAELLTRPKLRGRAVYRTLIFLPTTISVVIVAFIWQLILSPLWGLTDTAVLGNERTALVALSFISVWQYVGLPMLLFYAVLISVPQDLLDSARVDGASAWATFRHVKFPLVLPTLGVISIITYIANFNAFELVFTIKGPLAGPNYATDIMGTLFYREFFGYQSKLGSATIGATVASMTLLMILIGVTIYLVGWRRRVTTYEL